MKISRNIHFYLSIYIFKPFAGASGSLDVPNRPFVVPLQSVHARPSPIMSISVVSDHLLSWTAMFLGSHASLRAQSQLLTCFDLTMSVMDPPLQIASPPVSVIWR